ncbi:hypothetical protein GCM10010109_02590 [Actinoplanes campanulatus]|nr:hypothetical protein GCM10010109_02590 [Actinoplanes campanulatus]GID34206.1 hypothetical protein Aca09nite_07120 [Actinoplanes campanulatus]
MTLDEFTERVDRALACRTHGDLTAVTADLPASPREEDNRHLLWAFLAAAVVLVVFSVVLGLAR